MHEKHKSMKSHYIYTQLFKHCICLQCGRPRFDPWVGKIPWRRVWQSTPVFLPGKSHGQRTLTGYSPWVARVRHDLATKPPPPPVLEARSPQKTLAVLVPSKALRNGSVLGLPCGLSTTFSMFTWHCPRVSVCPQFPVYEDPSHIGLCACVLCHSAVSDSCKPMVCNWPGSSVHGNFQTRILK